MVTIGAAVLTRLDLWSDSVWQLFYSSSSHSRVSADATYYDLGVKCARDSLCLALVMRLICLNQSRLGSS